MLELLEIEDQLLVKDCENTYKKFTNNVKKSKDELIEILTKLKSQNKKIIAKSCPARAVVLLNYCGLNDTHLICS